MGHGLSSVPDGCTHLILDFDGVLADSEPLFRRSWNAALEEVGHRISEEDYWLHWSSLGEGLEGEIARRNLSIDSEQADRLRRRQRREYEGLCAAGEIPLARGAHRLLQVLQSASDFPRGYAVASNTESGLVREILRLGRAPVPDLIVGGEGLRRKPAPDIFLRAAELLGVPPERALVVEDSIKGIRAALAGGFPVVRVLNQQNFRHQAPALADLQSLEQLTEMLLEGRR